MELIELTPAEGGGSVFLNLGHVVTVGEHAGRETQLRLTTGEVVSLDMKVSDFLAKTKVSPVEGQFKLAPGQGEAFVKAWEKMAQER